MSDVDARRRWAYRMVRRCTEPPPLYGSAAWLALPEGSPAKVAAVIIAAEAWAHGGDDLEAEMRAELEAAWQAHKSAEDAAYLASYTAHREWIKNGVGKYAAERRARAAMLYPEGREDFPGGVTKRPVDLFPTPEGQRPTYWFPGRAVEGEAS